MAELDDVDRDLWSAWDMADTEADTPVETGVAVAQNAAAQAVQDAIKAWGKGEPALVRRLKINPGTIWRWKTSGPPPKKPGDKFRRFCEVVGFEMKPMLRGELVKVPPKPPSDEDTAQDILDDLLSKGKGLAARKALDAVRTAID